MAGRDFSAPTQLGAPCLANRDYHQLSRFEIAGGKRISQHLFHLQEVENPIAVRNDAANGVLPRVLPYRGKQLCAAVTSSLSGETRRIHSENFLSCNLRSTNVNFDVSRKGG